MRSIWVVSIALALGVGLVYAQDITLPTNAKQVRIVLKCPGATYWRAWKTVPAGNLIVTCGTTIPNEKAVELKSR